MEIMELLVFLQKTVQVFCKKYTDLFQKMQLCNAQHSNT